jgi:hypothetical protein
MTPCARPVPQVSKPVELKLSARDGDGQELIEQSPTPRSTSPQRHRPGLETLSTNRLRKPQNGVLSLSAHYEGTKSGERSRRRGWPGPERILAKAPRRAS